ncbi:6-carboxyhexanoate--CoA ligase [Calderihabitans maritimus]|nr:6-carboxyhexanoate--CoA ligase [Calderihabitans maritimus]
MKGLFSVKMRAAQGGPHEKGGRHVSGAEKIVAAEEVEVTVARLVRRALHHAHGKPDFINIKVVELKEPPVLIESLPVYQLAVRDDVEGREAAGELLQRAGVSAGSIKKALELIGFQREEEPGLKGAAVLDARTGTRLDDPGALGLRVTNMDLTARGAAHLEKALEEAGLRHTRLKEALVLASKVARAPGMVAELCFSDNPGYVAGYVAVPRWGYIRIPHFKGEGFRGGRVFFVRGEDYREGPFKAFLSEHPVLVDRIAPIYPPLGIKELLRILKEGEGYGG